MAMEMFHPAPLRERDVTRHIAREFYKEFDQLIESDVIIVGAVLGQKGNHALLNELFPR